MRIEARRLLKYSTNELWDILTGKFILVFDDGIELETDANESLFSSYLWDLVREFPETPFNSDMHLTQVMGGGTLSTKAWSELFSRVVWGVYLKGISLPRYAEDKSKVLLREYLSKRLYECVNNVYNDLTHRLEEYVTTIKIEDFLEVTNHPDMVALHARPNYTEADIEAGYALGRKLLIDDPEAAKRAGDPTQADLYSNMLSRYARGGYVDMNQSNQCVVFRGFITDIDSSQYGIPITTNLVSGMRKMYESLIESRSASKSLAFQSKPLQASEFFNRRSQMGGMVVKHLFPGDCGSTHYLPWPVRETDLDNLEGINYLDEDTGKLDWVKVTDTHLIGKTIQTRNPTMCMTPHPNGICETCFGQMSHSVYRRTNIGFQATSYMNEIMSQATLGVKHLDGSSIIRPMRLNDDERKYFSVNRSGDGYSLLSAWAGKDVWLVMRPEEFPGITDLKEVSNVKDLSYTRTSMLDVIRLEINLPTRTHNPEIQVGGLRRPASLTTEALQYIREVGWEIDNDGFYRVNLSKWDTSKQLMSVPRRNFNMSKLDWTPNWKQLGQHFSNCWKLLLGLLTKAKLETAGVQFE